MAAVAIATVALGSVHAGIQQAPDARAAAAIADRQADLAVSAEAIYDDAPHGVDPVVTGPVSETFRSRQRSAGCDTAEWPHIPAVCYPG